LTYSRRIAPPDGFGVSARPRVNDQAQTLCQLTLTQGPIRLTESRQDDIESVKPNCRWVASS
jgi:hypothetical protein